ncbi:Protein of unknown function [bacterium A37T11]|nr:Protein of unknown function [bacterium A37T11]
MKLLMKVRVSLGAVLLICSSLHVQGQIPGYRYQRQISGIEGQWNRLVLPDGLFKKASEDLSDIRIIGITAGKDTIEAPYLLKEANNKVAKKEITFRQLNSSSNDKGHYFTFEVPSADPINEITLELKPTNFDWKVKLEGSQDQQEWFTLLNNYRIVSIKNALTDFRFTTLSFPPSVYRYFRILIPGAEDPGQLSAQLYRQESTEGVYRTFPVKVSLTPINKKTKQRDITVRLPTAVRASYLKVAVRDSLDYYRPVTISYLTDSIKTEKGWIYDFNTLTNGTLNSLEKNEFTFPSTLLQTIKVTIDEQDNQPLSIGPIEVKGYVQELIARFTQPATYYLVYGKANAEAPQYDIAQFTVKIPKVLPELTLGEEQTTAPGGEQAAAPLFTNKAWLWAIIVIMVLLLGIFSIRMMRKVP